MSTKKEKCCWKCWVSKRNHKTGAVEVFCENSSCDCHQSESIEWEEKIRFAASEAIEAANKAITTAVAKREKELVEEVEKLRVVAISKDHPYLQWNGALDGVLSIIKSKD